MLISTADAQTSVIYPVIETTLRYKRGSYEVEYLVPSCCFHDLLNVPDGELAGMGLSIIGNLCRLLDRDIYDDCLFASLQLRYSRDSKPVDCPWPGMPDDRAVPLDLTKMPFESGMFLGSDDNLFKYRPDRLQMLARIEEVWVPWLRERIKLNA